MNKLLLALLFVCNSVLASDCADLYPEYKPIEVKNTVELCNSFFVTLYDNNNSRVILASERLKHGSIGSVRRVDAFHSDPRIGHHPNPSDYSNTGYDKGHVVPAGDASDSEQMYSTFSMTNMTPQKPTLNRNSWKLLEEHTRELFKNSKSDMYILNVVVYDESGNINGIPVPSGYWKIVTVDGKTTYFYADNVDHGVVEEKTPVDINKLLPEYVKTFLDKQ
jgi:endonuclease G